MAIQAHRPGAARLFGIGCAGTGAMMIACGPFVGPMAAMLSLAARNTPSHCLHGPYLKRTCCSTTTFAGTMSACSVTISPMRGRCWPLPHGHSLSASAMSCSMRWRGSRSSSGLRLPLARLCAGTVISSPPPTGALALSTSASLNSWGCAGSVFSELAPNCLCRASRSSSFSLSISNACSRTSDFRVDGSSGRSAERGGAASGMASTP